MSDYLSLIEAARGIPIRASKTLPVEEFERRLVEIYRLLDVEADVTPPGGMLFGAGEGAHEEDEGLIVALRLITARRFGLPEEEG